MMSITTRHKKLGRVAAVLLAVSLLVFSAAAVAAASELRRIDTGDVNDAHAAVKAVGALDEELEDHGVEETVVDEHGEEIEGEHAEEAEGGHAEEAEGEAAEEGGHHAPAWMVPGWQTIFTVLGVVYFGLGVTLLPFIMAKEDH